MDAAAVTVGVVKETTPGERRVALVPEMVERVRSSGMRVLVEVGAGAAAYCTDGAYADAGAELVDRRELCRRAEVVLCVAPPDPEFVSGLRDGVTLIGLLAAATDPALVRSCAAARVTAISLDLLPRTLSRAQSMDALASQANIAGYKAVLVAADTYQRFFPMLVTAAGTHRPAQVLVLGAGVAGLQAIGTARRLGALATGYDVRPEAQADVLSLGARFLDVSGVVSDSGQAGYARALTDAERRSQQAALTDRIAGFDVVISTAQVPGRKPPVLVTDDAIKGMRPGSVIVDLAAGPLGGNVEGSEQGRTVVIGDGVTVIGAGNLASEMASAASAAYARNIAAVLGLLVTDGTVHIDLAEEITAHVVVTHAGRIVNPTVSPTPAHPAGTGESS